MLFGRNGVKVCGYTIKPMGALDFIESLTLLEATVVEVVHGVFGGDALPDTNAQFSMARLVHMVFATANTSMPHIVRWLAATSGIPYEALATDPGIGLGGLAKVFAAVLEVNDLESFFSTALPAAKSVWQGISAKTPKESSDSLKP